MCELIARILSPKNYLQRFPNIRNLFSEMSVQVKRKIDEVVKEGEPAKKIVKPSRKVIRPGFGDEKYSETEYYFENGKFIELFSRNSNEFAAFS